LLTVQIAGGVHRQYSMHSGYGYTIEEGADHEHPMDRHPQAVAYIAAHLGSIKHA